MYEINLIPETNNCDCNDSCDDDCSCHCHKKESIAKTPKDEQKELIDFSLKIVSLLDKKRASHNKINPKNKIRTIEMKNLFMQGVIMDNPNKLALAELGFARVNCFLRFKRGEYDLSTIDIAASVTAPYNSLDIAGNWLPNSADIALGKKEVSENNIICLEATSSDDLYIETTKLVKWNWLDF